MRVCTLPVAEAVGHILCHNLADATGHKLFAKGHIIQQADLPGLSSLGLREIYVAVMEPGDVHENVAAQRLAAAVMGTGCTATRAHAGRVNLLAAHDGPLAIDESALLAVNDCDGLTIATRRNHTLLRARQTIATIKVIPFAVPEERLSRAEAIGRANGGIIGVRPLQLRQFGVVLVSSPPAQQRLSKGVYPAIAGRISDLGAHVAALLYVEPTVEAIAEALKSLRAQGVELIIIAGETSIMDQNDITPQGIRLAGARIEHYGAPVEPGNLFLLAYLERPGNAVSLPIIGAPGCVRSRSTNIVDMLLPRLMAAERVSRRDIIALGHGGLVE